MKLSTLLLVLVLAAPAIAGPAEAFAAATADAAKLPPEVREQTRYIRYDHLSEKSRALYINVWKAHAQELSRSPDIEYFRAVTPTLYAVTLDQYQWKKEVWEKLADIEPFYHQNEVLLVNKLWPGGNDANGVYYSAGFAYQSKVIKRVHHKAARKWGADALGLIVHSTVPLVDGDWLFVQSARQLSLRNKQTGAGYYDWLGIKDRATFEELIQVNRNASIKFGKELRAALDSSGVADQGRQIERYQALGGGAWRSLDSDDNSDKSNPVRLLGRDEYAHKAEEHYGALANGFFAYLLCDNKGQRQNTAPDFIGSNTSPLCIGVDKRIHVGISCPLCHIDGLRDIDDWVRREIKTPLKLAIPDRKKFLEARRAFFVDLQDALKTDRETFAKAVKKTTGYTLAEYSAALATCWNEYALRRRNATAIEAIMGLKKGALGQYLRAEAKVLKAERNIGIDPLLGGFMNEPDPNDPNAEEYTLRIEHLEELMPDLWRITKYGEN